MQAFLSKVFYACAVIALVVPVRLGFAQDAFPSKPVRLIVPVVGGSVELLAREIGQRLSASLGQPVVVENKAGAGGVIAADHVAKAAPDGYTLLLAFTPLAVNVSLFAKLPFDPVKDLAPITLAAFSPQYLAVNGKLPVTDVKEFVAYAKARRGELNYASISPGSSSHLTMEMFKSAAGIDLVHVPYKGGAGASADLVAGNVQAAFLVAANVMQFTKGGQLKVLASTGRNRLASTPDIPTLIESGFPDFEAISWLGFMAPAGTPKPILAQYHAQFVRILKMQDLVERLKAQDIEVVGSSPEEFDRFFRADIEKWASIIRKTGIKTN